MKKFFILVLLISMLCWPLVTVAQSNPQGFYLDSWVPKSIEVAAFDSAAPVTLPATVTITVDAANVITRVSPYIYGHNAAAWGGKLDLNTLAVNTIRNLNPHVIRWPGGSMSNEYFWKATSKATSPQDVPPGYPYADLLYGSNGSSWTMSVNNFYSLLSKTNATGSISVNYGYARIGTSDDPVLTAAKYAADWVRYDKGRTRFWEIGNENMGDWERGYEIDTQYNKDGQPRIISGDLYGRHCKVFIEEMRKAAREVGSDIKIGVVAMDSHVTYNTVQMNWNKQMMPHVASLADFFIVHSYYTPYDQNSSAATILNSPANTKNLAKYVNDGVMTHAGHDPLPLALTEWNIFATGSGQGVSYINGMQGAMVLGELIAQGFGQGNRWDFVNGFDNGNNHGLLADDEPKSENIPRYTPRAPFFYLYYFQKFFGDRMVHSVVTGNPSVVSYASKFYSGHSGIVVVNKGTTTQVTSLALKNFKKGSHFYYYVLTGGTDNGDFSRKVHVNGKTTTLAGGGPADYELLKPYGRVTGENILFELPGRSVVYLLVEGDTTLQTQTIQFDAPEPKVVGDSAFALSAVSTSGLPVSFATSDHKVAVFNDGMVRITGAGTCDIIAFQEGDTLFLPAEMVTRQLTVGKGEQTITFPALTPQVTGTPDVAPGATATSGLECTYASSNPAVATIVGGKIRIMGAGTAIITARQPGNIHYNPAEEASRELVVTINTGLDLPLSENELEIFPNPASESVTIKLPSHYPEMAIYNALGAVVHRTPNDAHGITLSTRLLGGPGVYFIRAGSVVKRLIVR